MGSKSATCPLCGRAQVTHPLCAPPGSAVKKESSLCSLRGQTGFRKSAHEGLEQEGSFWRPVSEALSRLPAYSW